MEKEVDGRKIKYYYDGSLLLAEKDGNGNILKIYINDGEGIVSMVRPIYNESNTLTHHQRLYYMYDSLGSVSVVAGENGLPLQNYTYSPYGSTMNVEYDPVNNLRFVGRYGGYKDDDTGQTYFWHRWYDEEDGRWISRDPIGICGGINYYSYTINNSLNRIDFIGTLMLIGIPPIDLIIILFQIQTYGNYCGKWWTGGRFTLFGILKPNWDVEAIDDLDSCCKQHDKGWNDCEERYKCSPNKDIEIAKCKNKKNESFCFCLKNTNAPLGTQKAIYLEGAKGLFCGK